MRAINRFRKLSGSVRLGGWTFRIIDLSDYDVYSRYIRNTEYPANLWSSNFAFLWAVSQSPTRKILWKIIDDMLVSFNYLKSGELYLVCLPFGKGSPDKVISVLRKSLDFCLRWNNFRKEDTVVKVINSLQLEYLRKSSKFDKYFKVIGLFGMEKYFSISKLIALTGKEYETIRRKLNKFKRSFPNAVVRKYRPDDFEEVIKLGEYWSDTSGQKYSHIFDTVYFRNIVEHYVELNHLILVVEENNKLIGMVSGGALPTGQSWWCLSKFIDDCDGLSEFLVVELAKEIHKRYPEVELMNAAEDLGPGGLRYFKERFRPVLDLRRYLLRLK